MVQTPIKPLTLESFLALPETKPASEFIDGQIFQKAMPKGKHSRLQKQLLFKIDAVVALENVAEVFPELRCSFGGRFPFREASPTIVPDLCVLSGNGFPMTKMGILQIRLILCQIGQLKSYRLIKAQRR